MAKRKKITPIYPYDPLDEFRNENSGEYANKSEKLNNRENRIFSIVVYLAVAATICTFAFAAFSFKYVLDFLNSREEYYALTEIEDELETSEPYKSYANFFDTEMRKINSEYMCWIKINNTLIDYPVVRADDNEKYLSMSFYGEENMFGTLFMDYRNKGEYVPNIIIYGHNMRTGDMFGGLKNYLDEQYMKEHPIITIRVNDRIIEYEVFAARRTDVNDRAYFLDFSTPGAFADFAESCGAPSDAAQIITLSTCVSAGDDNERVVVQGVLR